MIKFLRNLFQGEPLLLVSDAEISKEEKVMPVETFLFYPGWILVKCRTLFLKDKPFFKDGEDYKMALEVNEKSIPCDIRLKRVNYQFEDDMFVLSFRTKNARLHKEVRKHLDKQSAENK